MSEEDEVPFIDPVRGIKVEAHTNLKNPQPAIHGADEIASAAAALSVSGRDPENASTEVDESVQQVQPENPLKGE